VHGLGSNPDTTWRARKKVPASATCTHPRAPHNIGEDDYVCWVTDFLHNDLPPASRRRSRLFFYNHDSYWQRDAVQTRLRNLGQNLLHHINTVIRGTEEVGNMLRSVCRMGAVHDTDRYYNRNAVGNWSLWGTATEVS
jgi:hypothetical protein